ncbi:hypothetical protein D3C86_1310540 [compost metagenome]
MEMSLSDWVLLATAVISFSLIQVMPDNQPILGIVLLASLALVFLSTIGKILRSKTVKAKPLLIMASLAGLKVILFLGIARIPGVLELLVKNLVIGFAGVVGAFGVAGYFLFRTAYQPQAQSDNRQYSPKNPTSAKYSLRLYAIFSWVTLLMVLSIAIYLRDVEPYKTLSLVPMFSSPLLLLLLTYVYIVLPRRKMKGIEEIED